MLPDRVSNPGPLTYESGALPIALRGPTRLCTFKLCVLGMCLVSYLCKYYSLFLTFLLFYNLRSCTLIEC